MIREIALSFFLLFISIDGLSQLVSAGQPPSKPLSAVALAKLEKQEIENRKCTYKNRLNSKQRASLFPFNKASAVKLVSYEYAVNNSLSENGQVDTSKFREVKTISKVITDSLTDILYNYTWRNIFSTSSDVKCYMPRNAILFYDENGQIFAWIEICFACQKFAISNPKIKTGAFCDGKYASLKMLFKHSGINYGINEER